MNWIQSLNKAIHYIENNLTNEMSVESVSKEVYASNANFQRIFNLVMGMTIGDYIRNRRLSLPEEATDLIPFTMDDDIPYTFVFIEGKKETPPIAEVYRKALLDAPGLMRTPPNQNGDVFFGNDAFEQWATMLKGDFYAMTKEDYEAHNGIATWQYYGVYICIIATNIFHKKDTTDRAIQLNPDLCSIAPLLDEQQKALESLENLLREAGGYFDANYQISSEIFYSPEKRKEIARIMRLFPEVYSRICNIIEQVS